MNGYRSACSITFDNPDYVHWDIMLREGSSSQLCTPVYSSVCVTPAGRVTSAPPADDGAPSDESAPSDGAPRDDASE
jgi:hypothetical protein